MKQYTTLSIVTPNGGRIAQGLKTLEVRSWQPESFSLKNLVIVENQNFLLNDGNDEAGLAVALVDIQSAHPWQPDEMKAACASYWADGYYAWAINNVRPLLQPLEVRAKIKLYTLELHE